MAQAQPEANKSNSTESDYYDTGDNEFVRRFLKPGTFMRASEVKPGMEGYGLSVFRGTKIEKFNVRVIGVLKRVNNGKDAILVRLSGAPIGKNNVIRGMSGSPVYLNDKLIGAVSYGFDFSMEPIAGVTPIVDMLDAMAKPREPQTGQRLPIADRKIALSPSMVSAPADEVSRFRKTMVAAAAPRMVPLMAPVSLSGFSTRAQDYLRRSLESKGLAVSEGSGGGIDNHLSSDDIKEANTLKAGSAVGVMLTTGDFESASTGTVTANFDGGILGFGHPFVQAGAIDFPMASGYIHDVLPSLSISFKLSSPVAILGAVQSDRPWAIGGQVGRRAKMVPVTVEVSDGERRIAKKFSSSVVDHEDLTPELIAACAMSSMDATYQSSEPYVARVSTTVEIENQPTIAREDRLTNSAGSTGSSSLFRPFFSDPVSGSIHSITSRILNNRYKKAKLKSVKLRIHLESGRNLTRIVRVSTDRSVAKPGEKVTLTCLLEPFNGVRYTESVDMTIPRDAPDGDLALGVSGGSQLEDLRKRMNLIDPPTMGLEQIIKRIQEKPRGDRLFAVLALPNQAIHVDGEVFESPPGHWNKLFFSNRYTHGPSLVNGERRVSKEIPSLIEGIHILAVTVKRPEPYLEISPWYAATPSGSGKASAGAYVTAQAQKALDSMSKTDTKKPADTAAGGTTDASKSPPLSLWSQSSDDTHMRPVQVWSQMDDSAFKGGTKDGIIIDSWGRMFPGFKQTTNLSLPGDLRAWSAVWSKGAVYIGTSDRILRWFPSNRQPEEIARFDSVAVPAMAADSKGRIFAALAPSGRIICIDGTATKDVARLSESIVTSLAIDDEDSLYAGVTGTGKVYKLTAGGATVLADTGDAHVISMFFDRQSRRLYLGCGEQGNVYSVSKDGRLRAEYHSNDHLVTGVCRTRRGDLFITTAGSGHLIRVTPTGETHDLATSEAFYTLYYHPESDSVLAGDAEGDITQIQEEPLTGQSFFIPVKHTEQEAVVALCSDGGNRVYAVSSNLPNIFGFDVRPETATYTSSVKDAERPAHWSLLRVYGSFNEVNVDLEKSIVVETRTGATLRPDGSWGAWTPATHSAEGYQIKSKNDRYFQYRLSFTGALANANDRNVFPRGRESVVGRIATTFLPTNSRPRFSAVSLRAGQYINDTEEISIVGQDPDGDSLSLNIDISSDNGKSYKMLRHDLRAERTGKDTRTEGKKADKTSESKSEAIEKKDDKTEEKEKTSPQSGENPSGGNDTDSGEKPGQDEEPDGDNPSGGPDGDSTSGAGMVPEAGRSTSGLVELQHRPDKNKPEENKPEDKGKPEDKNKSGDKEKAKEKEGKKIPDKRAVRKAGKDVTKAQSPKDAKKKPSEGDQTDKFVWTLAANTLKDGHYIVRFTLSDMPSNMVQPQELRCYRYVVIDKVKPKIGEPRVKITGNRLSLEVLATDETSPIANATFQIDSEEPRAFAVVGGLADKRDAQLVASMVPLKKGAHKVEIEVVDRAGNKATRTVKLPTR